MGSGTAFEMAKLAPPESSFTQSLLLPFVSVTDEPSAEIPQVVPLVAKCANHHAFCGVLEIISSCTISQVRLLKSFVPRHTREGACVGKA